MEDHGDGFDKLTPDELRGSSRLGHGVWWARCVAGGRI